MAVILAVNFANDIKGLRTIKNKLLARVLYQVSFIFIRVTDMLNAAIQYLVRFIDERDRVTKFFNRFHTVGREKDCCAFAVQFQYLIFNKLRIYRVKTAKGLVEYDQVRLV